MKKPSRRKPIRKPASVKSTGGGFTFADKVGAFFLLDLLRGGTPLGPEAGQLIELHFATRESGWLMDDQLLVLKKAEGLSRCAISVKSDTRLTNDGLDREFVADAWRHWQGFTGNPFDLETLLSISVPTLEYAPAELRDLSGPL